VKPYAEAHNHLILGEVLEDTPTWVRIRGRTFHWGRSVEHERQVRVGALAVRIVPWSRVEIVNELPASFEVASAKLASDGKGTIALKHDKFACVIVSKDTRNN
jgi:hypothetical protein